jgi:hypothetical protein
MAEAGAMQLLACWRDTPAALPAAGRQAVERADARQARPARLIRRQYDGRRCN